MSVEVETTNLLGDIEFIKPPSLLQKIGGGLTGLATGQISKNDFFRDAVVLNVLDELDVPSIVKNNLNKSEKAQNIALDAIQQAVGSPVNLTALDENRYLADYRKQVGPGILSLQSELGRGEPTGSVRFDSRNFMIAPKTTARFGAGIDNLGKDFSAGVTYKPDTKTFVEGKAVYGSGRSPEYRLSFGKKFSSGGIAKL